jgi:O-antigen/teichoic acid export membrane protein
VTRLLRMVRRPAVGAVLGQVTQALGGLVLSVAAARALGAAGLAAFSLAYGCTVLVTAVVSGLVGDSLTVLDRGDRGIRAALLVWAVGVAVAAGLAAGALAAATGSLPGWAAAVLGLAVTAFVLEDALRRLLMATGRFWSLPAVDGTGLVAAVGTLAACAAAGGLSLASFAVALLIGQTAAAAVAWAALPATERPRGPWRDPRLGAVWSFGVWRAAAQTIRPLLVTGLRLLVVAAAGAAAYGELEAARVYTAPTLVVVAGLGSFLLPHLVATRGRPAAERLRAADRVALGLAGAVAGIGVLAVVLQPVAEQLLTGGAFAVPVAAVAGWSAYAVASAVLLPYANLATVQRRQRRLLCLRLLELGSLGAVWVLVTQVEGGAVWAPLALAAGPLVVAAAVRRTVLRPLAADGAAVGAPRGAVPA